MNGFDALLSREVEDAELHCALTEAMRLQLGQLVVLHDYPLHEFGDDVRVICMKTILEGDFPLKVSIDVFDDGMEFDPIEVAQKLATTLGINLLLDDGTPNPYTMLLIRSSEKPVVASLNIEDASNDVYRLVDQSLIVPCR